MTLPNTAYCRDKIADVGILIQLTEKEKIIMNILKDAPRISLREVAEKAGMSYKVVWKQANGMREKGLVEHLGSQKSGYWKILQ